jgi:hypothetical protein
MLGDIRKAFVSIAIAAFMIVPFVSKSAATISTEPTFVGVDLRAENRILAAYLEDLRSFDKQGADLGKRPSVSRTEFAAYERQGDELKRRVSDLQNTLRQVIDKFKAAGQWDNLEQTLLAKIKDSEFQNFVRTEGFKKTLDEAASGRNINVNEIASPVEVLRNKVQGRASDPTFERGNSALASRAVRVAYTPAPAMFASNVRCRLARLRFGISGAVSNDGKASAGANVARNCFCGNIGSACDTRFAVD